MDEVGGQEADGGQIAAVRCMHGGERTHVRPDPHRGQRGCSAEPPVLLRLLARLHGPLLAAASSGRSFRRLGAQLHPGTVDVPCVPQQRSRTRRVGRRVRLARDMVAAGARQQLPQARPCELAGRGRGRERRTRIDGVGRHALLPALGRRRVQRLGNGRAHQRVRVRLPSLQRGFSPFVPPCMELSGAARRALLAWGHAGRVQRRLGGHADGRGVRIATCHPCRLKPGAAVAEHQVRDSQGTASFAN
mmetsp:Transcript_133241/g.385618  ORF Transcript_133241/g.385618 Transcript_133241/m.385618 type:complete len:247 (+) Transcript_133241:371-1111(+)